MRHWASLRADGDRGRTHAAALVPDPPPVRPGVLIVEDNPAVRRVLVLGMSRYGLAVWASGGGREAVEVYRAHHPSIGLALLDVCMPGRDGPETLADLRAVDPRVRACFMTGEPGRYTERELLDLGALVVFWKPFDLGRLAARLEELMGDERSR